MAMVLSGNPSGCFAEGDLQDTNRSTVNIENKVNIFFILALFIAVKIKKDGFPADN